MNRIFVLAFSILFILEAALAQLPPTSSKGQSGSKTTTFDFQAPHQQFTKTSSIAGLVETGSNNALKNPGFEATTFSSGWTASGSSTMTVGTSTNIGTGSKSMAWDASAASEYLTSDAITIPAGWYGNNGEVSCSFKTTATDVVLQAYDGSSVVAYQTIVATTNFGRQTLNFPIPSSGTIALRLASASNSAAVYMDDCYAGLATNLSNVAQASLYGSLKYAGTTNCAWSRTGGGSNSFGNFSADTDCPTATLTNNASAPATKIPGVTFTSLPPGDYLVTASFSGYKGGTNDAAIDFQLSDGTNAAGAVEFYPGTAQYTAPFTLVGKFSYSAQQSSITFQIQGLTANTSNTVTLANDSSTKEFTISVYRFPTQSEIALRQSNTPWYVDATMDGANPSLGVANVSSYTEITDAGLTLKPQTGSQAVGVMCSGTNAATSPSTSNTTCAAGSESVGINFNIPEAGAYEVCFYGAHWSQLTSGDGVNLGFQIIETPTNAQTLTLEGGTRQYAGGTAITIASGVSDVRVNPISNCSIFNWTSSGSKGVRLMYEQSIVSSPDQSLLIMDASSAYGQPNARWTVKPISRQQPQPLLVGSVTSDSSGLERTIRVAVAGNSTPSAVCSSSPCTIVRQSGASVTSVTRASTGLYTVNVAPGTFSAPPVCTVAVGYSGVVSYGWGAADQSSSTAIVVQTFNAAGTTTDHIFGLNCTGPR